jgi:hypothetical protein
MAQVTGRVFISVRGKRLASKEGAKLIYGNPDRETVIADTGVVGYMEKVTAPGVECTIAHTADFAMKEYGAMTDVTLSFDCDSGKSFILNSAWCAKALELEKGEVKLTFGALSCTEV